MVSQLNVRTPARDASYEMAQYIAARVTANAAGTAVLQKIGTLPAGAVVHGIHNSVQTAFAGGTPLLTFGVTGTAYSDLQATVSEATANEFLQAAPAFVMPVASDTDVYANLTGSATAGAAICAVMFYKPIA